MRKKIAYLGLNSSGRKHQAVLLSGVEKMPIWTGPVRNDRIGAIHDGVVEGERRNLNVKALVRK